MRRTEKSFWPIAWQFYFRFYTNSIKSLILSVAVSLLQSLLLLLITYLMRYLVDDILPDGDIKTLFYISVSVGFLFFLNSLIALGGRYLILKIVRTGTQTLRIELIKRYYNLPRSYYSELDTGLTHAMLVEDTAWLNSMTDAFVAKFIPSAIISTTLMVLLFFLNRLLFFVLLIAAPPLLIVNHWIKKKLEKYRDEFRQADHVFSKGILFLLQMMDLTKIHSAETIEIEQRSKEIKELSRTGTIFFWLLNGYQELQNSIITSSNLLILIIGGWSISNGMMTVGELLSFFIVAGLLSKYLNGIWSSIPLIISGQRSVRSLQMLLNANNPPVYPGKEQVDFNDELIIDSVSFQYKDKPILRDVNLVIHPGLSIAILGSNGAGKSTLAYLVMGFYRPLNGYLSVDGIPYDELDIKHLRKSMGMLFQDPVLFYGTIWENITYGFPDAQMDEVVRVAKITTAHSFISELPHSYHTHVGAQGVLLSGGQRQMVAWSRVLLRQPKLLILDEPTNHLDVDTLNLFMENIEVLKYKPAIIFITHNRKILHDMDQIYHLERGKIYPYNDSNPPPNQFL